MKIEAFISGAGNEKHISENLGRSASRGPLISNAEVFSTTRKGPSFLHFALCTWKNGDHRVLNIDS